MERQFLRDETKNKWYLLENLMHVGTGTKIFYGCEIGTDKEVIIKSEDNESKANGICKASDLAAEFAVYQRVRGFPEFAKIMFVGEQVTGKIMVMEKLGPSIAEMLKKCARFSVRTVALLSNQILCRLQCLHQMGYIHRNISVDNMVVGREDPSRLYIIGFGHAIEFDAHKANWMTRGFVGSPMFASISAHSGREQCRADDLISLGYSMVYMLTGRLPWAEAVHAEKRDMLSTVYHMKRNITIEELCHGVPGELNLYFEYCNELGFNEVPDYRFIRELMLRILDGPLTYNYDWYFLGIKRYGLRFDRFDHHDFGGGASLEKTAPSNCV